MLRENYGQFRKYLPVCRSITPSRPTARRRSCALSTRLGASFDVASVAEFLTVHENVKDLPEEERQNFIWDRIIYANPIKATDTLEQLDPYKPLVTYDNHEEVHKIARHAPHAGLVLRLCVPNTGSMVELSSKFGALPGEAVDLIAFARNNKLEVEGLSFHVGSQCTNVQNYIQALQPDADCLRGSEIARVRAQAPRHRRRLSRALRRHGPRFQDLASAINPELDRLFPPPDRDSRRAWPLPCGLGGDCSRAVIGKAVRGASSVTTLTTASIRRSVA